MLSKQSYVVYGFLNGSRFRLQCDMIKVALIDLVEMIVIDYDQNDSYRCDQNDTLWDIYIYTRVDES
ncbi:unnamed protein product [Rotaria magnacalcarata]|uniref:Uncharacterized protein n=1 Tax=Rotaria magnacalcarata TaxID=392030 RepID=A0A817AB89_9BILA|nr:unnamed protein product [Rotaria magnacalcarata]